MRVGRGLELDRRGLPVSLPALLDDNAIATQMSQIQQALLADAENE